MSIQEEDVMNNQLTEKQRKQKAKQLERLNATIDKGKLHYITFLPICIALGTAIGMTLKHGIISGVVGFTFGFVMTHIYYRSSWSSLNKTANKLQKELLS